MPAPYGLTATGFSRKTLQEVLEEIEAEEKARIDSRLNTEPEEPIGQLNGIFASKLAELWELAEAVNAGRFPDGASGFQLDEVASITGTLRGPATKGTVTLDLTASAPTTVPAGSIAQVLGDDANRWVTLEDVVFAAPGTLSVEAEAEVAGVFIANPTTITVIVTPVAGWTDVTNPASATPGTDIDTDAQLRIRRENELARAGSATVDAIRTDVLDVEDVTSVTIFHNPTNFVDGDGLPPGTVEALVIGGTDQDVRDALLATVAAGVDTFGTTVGTAADSQGKLHTVRFTRPVEIDILVEIDLTIDAQEYPAGGDALVQAAVESYINSLPVGFDVFQSQVSGAGIDAADGILNVTAVRIGSVSPAVAPVASDYTITARQLATMSAAANVTVATTPGVPDMAKQASVNLTPATGAVAIFDLMTFLAATLGWVVLEASDGSTYEADVPTNGNPITGGGAGAGGMANANAWFRIREPGGAGQREWTFQRDATNNTDWRVKMSALDGFTGGTPGATQTPSNATDEQILHGSGTDAAPVHAALFEADGTYRWHLVGFDVAEDTVWPFYAYTAETGTGVPRTLIFQESLESGTYPALVGTRAAPTSGEPDAVVYCCAYDPSGSDPLIIAGAASGQWQDRTAPPGKAWYAMNGSNGESEAFVDIQASSIMYSQSFADQGAPADAAGVDGFGANPLSGEDQLFPTFFGRPAGMSTQVHGRGMSAHIRISGVDRSYPDTATVAGETWVYTVPDGMLLPFDDGVTPLT